MAGWIRGAAIKPDNQSSIPRTHMVQRTDSCELSSNPQMSVCAHTNKYNKKFKGLVSERMGDSKYSIEALYYTLLDLKPSVNLSDGTGLAYLPHIFLPDEHSRTSLSLSHRNHSPLTTEVPDIHQVGMQQNKILQVEPRAVNPSI